MKYFEVYDVSNNSAYPQYFTSPEQAANFIIETFGEEGFDKFALREANQAEEMNAEIRQATRAQMQEDERGEGVGTQLAKGALRFVAPYMTEEAETKGEVTSSGATRDLARGLTSVIPTASVAKMIGVGAGLLGQDVSAQSEYQGEIDPVRTAVGGLAVGAAPVAVKGAQVGAQKVGDVLKGRGIRQMWNAILPDKTARSGKNPITNRLIEKHILEKNRVPILASEETAMQKVSDDIIDDLDAEGKIYRDIARNQDGEIPVYYKRTPEVSHMEAVPNPEFTSAMKQAEVDALNVNNPKKAQYTKQMKKWEKDPYATFMEKPEAPELQPIKAPQFDEWAIEKVIEQPEKITKGAYENARRRILVDYKNNKDVSEKIVKALDTWFESQAPKKGGMNVSKAVNLVTDLNKVAKTFDKPQGGTSPHELAKNYMAQEVNAMIEKTAPDVRAQARTVGELMALKKPLADRASANAVKASVGSGIRSELGRFINRSPQGAQAQYNLGRKVYGLSIPSGSNAVNSAIRGSGTSVGQMLGRERYE